MDRFGASDAWLMFLLWAAAVGHLLAALVAFVILTLYVFALSPRHARKVEAADGVGGHDDR
jgi:hypothetical protein